jgi:UDP-2-acetamido-2-deoxy-ribo-hexuluronate aminotransferase
LAEKCRSIVNHGMDERYFYDRIGINSRLDSLQAAVLDVKLKYLDKYNSARLKAANTYDNLFKSSNRLKLPSRSLSSSHVFHQYTLTLSEEIDRDGLLKHMSSKRIPVKVYYPKALHTFHPYKLKRYKEIDFKVTNDLCNRVISLPMHTELDDKTIEYICKSLLEHLDSSKHN